MDEKLCLYNYTAVYVTRDANHPTYTPALMNAAIIYRNEFLYAGLGKVTHDIDLIYSAGDRTPGTDLFQNHYPAR